MELTGGEALAQQLVREGVSHIFGVPGVQLDNAMDGLAGVTDQITFMNARHEQGGAYMADGYARSTGKVGVCMVVPGPGLLNAAAGLATAHATSSPVLCISGQIPSHTIGRGLGMLHEVPHQSRILDSLTKWHALAATPNDVPALIREAFRQLRSGRPRPVAVEIPPDVLAARGAVELLAPDPNEAETGRMAPDPDAVRAAAELLRTAERPAIWAGWGVQASDATEELRAVAEALEAPVIMNRGGRGSLSDRHHLALTAVGGRKVLPDADVVLVVGSRFLNLRGLPVPTAPDAKIILINVDANDLGEPRHADVAVHADARLALAALQAELAGTPRASRREELDAVRAWCAEQVASIEPQMSWLRALRGALPDDGIFVNELTQVGYVARSGFPSYGPRATLTPGYQGTLGYGFPTALGVKVGNPDRAVVSITGDGGFGWGLSELATAAKYGIGLATVVFNDGAFGNVRRTQKDDFGGRYIGTDLVNPDYVKLGEAFGVASERAASPDELRTALEKAFAAGAPTLIEVPVGEMPSAWHLIG